MGAELRLENMRQDEDRGRRGRLGGFAWRRRIAQMRERSIGLVQGRDVDDPQHRVEDDQTPVRAEAARRLIAIRQE